ncbi:MAG: DUF202 domain-containing protein [Flavobacteriales bacterium]|nr:DUF202 domain-containing protein [Flavobacteriales bacterium]MBP7408729.1 DUF202 domain-containing protein [Flavobacteriales bacterium]
MKKFLTLPFLEADHDFTNKDELILRDHLALVRTRLANERTLLSYIRSTLYLLIGGIALIQVEGYGDLRWAGYISLVLSAGSVIIGAYRYYTLREQLSHFYTLQVRPTPPLTMP